MAITRITVIRKVDCSTRKVFQAFYSSDQFVPVVLEPGEEVLSVLMGNTILDQMIRGEVEAFPEDLKSEMLAILDAIEREDFLDISDKLK